MKRFSVIAGIALTLLPLGAAAQQKTLYQRIVEQVRDERAVQSVDEEVLTFVRLAVEDEEWNLTNDEIEEVVKGFGWKVCGDKPTEAIGESSAECTRMISTVNDIAKDQQEVRRLGRTLQSIATGYELPLSDLPDRALRLSADLQGILNIWSAGTGSIQTSRTPPVTRNITIPEDDNADVNQEDVGDLLDDLARELRDLTEEPRIAAVWRYSQGVRLIRDERSPRFIPPEFGSGADVGKEGQYLAWRWNDDDDCDQSDNSCIEKYLMDLWDMMQDLPVDPPLTSSETAYVLFPAQMLSQKMPDNIIVWVRLDGDSTNDYPFGDAGLQWSVPLEPVQPSLFFEDEDNDDELTPILGGEYPPELEGPGEDPDISPEGNMLCTGPGMLRGYLCRPIPSKAEKKCPNPRGTGNGIQLVTCTDTGSVALRYTNASSDVCREISWKKSAPFDPQTQCKIAFRCSSNCAPGAQASAVTSLKKPDGTIEICMNHQTEFANTYLLYHELAHAYDLCDDPPGFAPFSGKTTEEQNELCCRREGEGYAAQCAMMERDGVFEDGNGNPIVIDGIPMNTETCAEVWADFACGPQQGYKGCYTSRDYSDAFKNELIRIGKNNPKGLAASCSDAINPQKMDPRVEALKELVERRDDVCRPDEVTEYKNRIGNNLCYVGQCVEQSIEQHRMTPGRRPGTISDMAAPWNDPMTGSPLGNLLTSPVVSDDAFPIYQPYLLVRTLDGALCQSVGLPALSPSVLCLAEANRQLELTRESGLQTALGLLGQNLEQQENLHDLTDLARGIGARAGTEIYGNYLRNSTRSFADIIDMANTLLKQLKNVEFPTQMCPTDPGLPSSTPSQS
jgi:hypothetical protein